MHDFLEGKFHPRVITKFHILVQKLFKLLIAFCFSKEKHKKKYFVPTVLVKIFTFSVSLFRFLFLR